MASPDVIFPLARAAQFDDTGRPYNSLFYTITPNYYELMHRLAERTRKCDELFARTPDHQPPHKLYVVCACLARHLQRTGGNTVDEQHGTARLS
jgi:hypothetical protein